MSWAEHHPPPLVGVASDAPYPNPRSYDIVAPVFQESTGAAEPFGWRHTISGSARWHRFTVSPQADNKKGVDPSVRPSCLRTEGTTALRSNLAQRAPLRVVN